MINLGTVFVFPPKEAKVYQLFSNFPRCSIASGGKGRGGQGSSRRE